MRQLFVLLAFAVVLVVTPHGVARAQWMACDLSICHVALACTTDTECAPLTPPACEAFDTGVDGMGGARHMCRPVCGTLFTCGSMGLTPRCPILGGDPGVCGTGVLGSGLFTAVCRFPGWGIDYCTAAGTPIGASRFDACHHRGGVAQPNYLMGDCDNDMCPNYRDPHPCVTDPAAACPPEVVGDLTCIGPGSELPLPDAGVPDAGARDAGLTVLDAGAIAVDANVVTLDGSAIAEDGGEAVVDAGPAADGAVAVDAGAGADASTTRLDAGSSGTDASVILMDGAPSFEGGGGCSCRVASTRGRSEHRGAAALAGLGVLALVAVRRRRR